MTLYCGMFAAYHNHNVINIIVCHIGVGFGIAYLY